MGLSFSRLYVECSAPSGARWTAGPACAALVGTPVQFAAPTWLTSAYDSSFRNLCFHLTCSHIHAVHKYRQNTHTCSHVTSKPLQV